MTTNANTLAGIRLPETAPGDQTLKEARRRYGEEVTAPTSGITSTASSTPPTGASAWPPGWNPARFVFPGCPPPTAPPSATPEKN